MNHVNLHRHVLNILTTFRCAGVVDMCKRDSMVFEAFFEGSRNCQSQRNLPIWLTKLLEIVTYRILVLLFWAMSGLIVNR